MTDTMYTLLEAGMAMVLFVGFMIGIGLTAKVLKWAGDDG